MAMFKCREFDARRGDPFRIEMPEGGWSEVAGGDSEDAAEVFASELWDNSAGERGTKFRVEVLLEDGTIERWFVEVEFDPVFCLELEETDPTPTGKGS